jgi:hypothetical protein
MYLDILNNNTKYFKRNIWKMKVPQKVKVFTWFLHREEILIKDNLTKRNWTGSETCCFCDCKECIQHLFFDCPFAKIIWRIIYMTFGLTPPKNITNLFGNWLKRIPKRDLVQIKVEVRAVIWTMWNTRNGLIFNKPKTPSFLQVIPMIAHWIRTWSYVQQEEQRAEMDFGCNCLETDAQDLFHRCGRRSHKRIAA